MLEIHQSFKIYDGPPPVLYGIVKVKDLGHYMGRPEKFKDDIANVLEDVIKPLEDVYQDTFTEVEKTDYSLIQYCLVYLLDH